MCYLKNDNDEGQQWQNPNKNDKLQFNLDRLYGAIEEKRERKTKHIIFHEDNACPHVECGIYSYIRHIHRPKLLQTITSIVLKKNDIRTKFITIWIN